MTAIPDYTATYDPDTDVDAHFTRATGRRIAPWLRPGDRLLELGCATGLMTTAFVAARAVVTAVDRSGPYLDRLRERSLPLAAVVEGDVETLELHGPYDHVVATSLLHEVGDPEQLLRRIAAVLAPGGLAHVTLQNPRSIHRLVALEMGLIDDVEALSARGVAYGSTRLWTAEALAELCARAGLTVAHREGVFLKPLPNEQLATLGADVLAGLEAAARHLPDFCALTYLVLRRG
jgi:ubiquinone/menaquinone biosynthesis C-methylase UbiE